jgi:hypothetical protein
MPHECALLKSLMNLVLLVVVKYVVFLSLPEQNLLRCDGKINLLLLSLLFQQS